jgi:hypothetical protein
MTSARSLFYASPAWVGRIEGRTRCGFWPRHPDEVNYDPVLLVPLDLARTPAAAREGRIEWDEIQVDDLQDALDDGGVTSIGPRFPDGRTTGVAYLAKAYRDRLRSRIRPPFPPAGFSARARDYEFMTVVYHDGTDDTRAGQRYHGFHARILKERGSSAFVAVHHAGRSGGGDPPLERTLDLASLECDAHSTAGGLTEIALGKRKQKEGALFIQLPRAVELGIAHLGLASAHPGGFRPTVVRLHR